MIGRFQTVTTLNDTYLIDSSIENGATEAVFVGSNHKKTAENVAVLLNEQDDLVFTAVVISERDVCP